jgi:hypothetical protein
MPYSRSLFAVLLIVVIGLALFAGPRDPYFAPTTFWYLAGFVALLFCMAATGDFFLQFVALLFTAYFVQRVVVLYFFPEQFLYSRSMLLTLKITSQALLFVILCAAATLVGWWLARLHLTPRHPVRRLLSVRRPAFSIGRYSISFERLFLYYAVIAGSLLVLQIVLLVGAGIGAANVVYDRAFAPIYRLSFIMTSSGFLPFYALARRETPKKIRIVALLFIALQLSLATAVTSKGTLITIVVYSIICWHFAGRRIPRKMAWLGLSAVLLTAFVFFPLMSMARLVVIRVLADPQGWRSLFSAIAFTRDAGVAPSTLFFSARLGGFDWLVGLMTFGRENFPSWVGTSGDFIHILNDMVPGDIIEVPGYIPIEQLMPMYLRGVPSVEVLGGHAEVMGVAGMAYLYYGLTLGPFFFLVWSFVTTKVLRSNLNTIVKILYFSCFVVGMVIGGGFIVTVERFYEGLITLALLILLDVLLRKILFAGPDARVRRRRAVMLPAASR